MMPVYLALSGSIVHAQGLVSTEGAQTVGFSSWEIPSIIEVVLFIILPLMLLTVHIVMTYKTWRRTGVVVRAINALVMALLGYLVVISIKIAFATNIGIGVLILYYVYPLGVIVLMGWVVKYVADLKKTHK